MNEIVSKGDLALDDEIGALAEEFNARLKRGEKPTAQQYAKEYPHLAELILSVFPALEIMGKTFTTESRPSADGDSKLGVLGDYQILHEAGRGGMGVVYEAQQISLDRRVALKVLPFAAVLDERQIKRFHNEARAAAQLKHPNIVQVYGVGCERSIHFYAMEFVEGETLESVIANLGKAQQVKSSGGSDESDVDAPAIQNEPSQEGNDETAFGWETTTPASSHRGLSGSASNKDTAFFQAVARIGADIADALDHAHVEGIVHRDIKPSNLMLDGRGKVWITDFGLARIETDAGITMTGDLLGTMRYMSPEQALAHRVVIDHRTDVYSLGVTLYELVALRPAFPHQQQQELLKHIAFEGPTRIKKINPRVPHDLATILGKAIERNPSDRYATAKAMADDLRRFLDQHPISARPPRMVDIVSKWARRHWKPIAATLAAVLLAAATGMVMLERNRGQLAKANSNLAVANQEMEALVHYTTGQYLLEKGDLRPAYREICSAIQIENRWEYRHKLAKICESARSWVPVTRIAVDQSPEWVRTVSSDALGSDELVILRIGSRLEVHSVRDGRMVQQRELTEEEASATVDVLLLPPSSTAPHTEMPRLVHLSAAGRLTLFTVPTLEPVAPAYTSALLQQVQSLTQDHYVRLVSDADGRRIAVPIGRQVVVLDISDPHAVSTIDTFEAKREVESVQLSPQGAKLLVKLSGPWHEAYVKLLLNELPAERVLVWDYGCFLDANKLLGFKNFAAGGLHCEVNIHDLKLKRQTTSLAFESLTLSHSNERQPGLRILENMFRKTELTEDLLTVINGPIDLKSVPTSSIVKASNIFPNADAKTRFLHVNPETMTIICEQGSELFVVRPASAPVAFSQRAISLRLWNGYQHKGELFVNFGGVGTYDEFALYDVARLMLPGNLESKQARTTFRLVKPSPTVDGRFVIPHAITMNATHEGDRLAVLWGESDADTVHGKVHRLEAYIYDKSDVADAAKEVEPIVRVPLSEVGVVGMRDFREFALTPNGKTVLLCTNHQVFAYDTENATLSYRAQDLFADRLPIAFSVAPDQRLAASGDPYEKSTIKAWDVERGTIVFETKKKALVKSMAFDMNGQSLWVGWMDGSLDVHRLSDGQLLKSLRSSPAPKAISPTENRFIGTRSPAQRNLGTRELVDSETGATISGMVFGQYWHILNRGWYTPDGRIVTVVAKYKVTLYNSESLDSADRFLQNNFPLETTLRGYASSEGSSN